MHESVSSKVGNYVNIFIASPATLGMPFKKSSVEDCHRVLVHFYHVLWHQNCL